MCASWLEASSATVCALSSQFFSCGLQTGRHSVCLWQLFDVKLASLSCLSRRNLKAKKSFMCSPLTCRPRPQVDPEEMFIHPGWKIAQIFICCTQSGRGVGVGGGSCLPSSFVGDDVALQNAVAVPGYRCRCSSRSTFVWLVRLCFWYEWVSVRGCKMYLLKVTVLSNLLKLFFVVQCSLRNT